MGTQDDFFFLSILTPVSLPKLTLPLLILLVMATDQQNQSQNLPQMLLLWEPAGFAVFGEQSFTSNKFHFLKAYGSTFPLHQFLSIHAESVDAILDHSRHSTSSPSGSAGGHHKRWPWPYRFGWVSPLWCGCCQWWHHFLRRCCWCGSGLALDVVRKITAANRYIRRGVWPSNGEYPLGSKVSQIFFSSFVIIANNYCCL